jgi:hypothetical protein
VFDEQFLRELAEAVGEAGIARSLAANEVAWRLHTLTRILAALTGSYNDYGIRSWFHRPRAQFDGRSPADVFATVEDCQAEAERLRANGASGLIATAALLPGGAGGELIISGEPN